MRYLILRIEAQRLLVLLDGAVEVPLDHGELGDLVAHPGGQLPLLLDAVRLLHLHPLQDPAPQSLGLTQGLNGALQVVALLIHLGQQSLELGLHHQRQLYH